MPAEELLLRLSQICIALMYCGYRGVEGSMGLLHCRGSVTDGDGEVVMLAVDNTDGSMPGV